MDQNVLSRGVVAGSSMQDLGKRLSQSLSIPFAQVDLSRFPNQELRVRVHEAYETTYLMQSFSQPVNSGIIEFLLMADAVKRMDVAKIVAVIPWFGYSKQDKVFLPGEPLSVKVIAQLLQSTSIRKLITIDLHNVSIAGYFDIPVVNLSAASLFLSHLKPSVTDDTVVVSPDAGSVKRSTKFAQELDVPVVQINKQRDLHTGEVRVLGISEDIGGKAVIIFDDMIATGSTMVQVSEYLKAHGAKTISICATHHLYISGVQAKLDASPIDTVFVTDTVPLPRDQNSDKLTVLSVAELLAAAI